LSNGLLTASPRRPVAASLLLMAFCLLSACRPDTSAPIKADATMGYCPVCKMQVKASDEWAAELYYNDGTKLMFESPGDLLAFYTAPNKYQVTVAQKDRANITKIALKDYPSKQVIDGRQARLVYNSKLEGPMGADFFPFGKPTDAETFVASNGGKIVGLEDVSSDMVQSVRKSH
jgi:copper chaperone NosL